MPGKDLAMPTVAESTVLARLVEPCWDVRPVCGPVDKLAAILGEAEVMEALVRAAEHLRRTKDATHRFRCFIENTSVEADVCNYLPQAGDSLKSYYERTRSRTAGRPFGVVADELELVSFDLWSRAHALIAPVVAGHPPRHASIGVFLGDNPRTGFGVHRDPHATLMLVVTGEKTLRLWPSEGYSGARSPAECNRSTRYEDILDGSLVMTVSAGDFAYWPASYYHVAENPAGTLSLTVNLAFGADWTGPQLFWTQFRRLWMERVPDGDAFRCLRGGRPDFGAVERGCTALAEYLPDARAVRRSVALELLRLETSLGFSTPARPEPVELHDDDLVAGELAHPIRVERYEEGAAAVAVNGYVFDLAPHPQILSLIADLNGGAFREVAELCSRDALPLAGDDAAQSRDVLRAFLQELANVGALRLRERPAIGAGSAEPSWPRRAEGSGTTA